MKQQDILHRGETLGGKKRGNVNTLCRQRTETKISNKKAYYDQIINLSHGFSNCGLLSSQELFNIAASSHFTSLSVVMIQQVVLLENIVAAIKHFSFTDYTEHLTAYCSCYVGFCCHCTA